MTKNLRKLKFATLCCLLMLAPDVVLGQPQAVSELTPFDRYGRIPWYEETDHLDRFATELIKHLATASKCRVENDGLMASSNFNRGVPPRLRRCRSFSFASSHRTRA
jgi:hypothetical protein